MPKDISNGAEILPATSYPVFHGCDVIKYLTHIIFSSLLAGIELFIIGMIMTAPFRIAFGN